MRRKKSTVKPNLPKEYVWTLDIDGEEKIFKCLVTETEVITYEGDVEHKHLKIMNPECMEGVLQIDTVTKIYDDMVEFQLERFIPYIKIDGHWKMSETTEMDRVEEAIGIHQKNSKIEAISGIACLAIALGKKLLTGDLGDWWMLNVFGIFFLASSIMRMVRLRNEINAMKEAAEEEAAQKAASKAAAEEEPAALEASASEEE